MKRLPALYFLYLVFFSGISPLHATHNRSGEITFRQVEQYTVEATITTYTKESSVAADRDSLLIDWGDGHSEYVLRINGNMGNGQSLDNNIKKNIYISTHTYNAIDQYTISMTDANRNAGVLNINMTNSVIIPFHLESTFELMDWNMTEPNHSPVLLEAPIDKAFLGQTFVHIPNAFDVDGDSIAYELIVPLQGPGEEVPFYLHPNEIGTGTNATFTLDPVTGVLTWSNPQLIGEYNVAMVVKSYRNGFEIDRIIRDMQIEVLEEGEAPIPFICQGPPRDVINTVSIGDTVRIDVVVPESDPFLGLEISSSCGLYNDNLFINEASFSTNINDEAGTAQFEWIVGAEHIRTPPYQLVIKVRNDFAEYGPASFALFRFQVDQVLSTQRVTPTLSLKLYPNPVGQHQLFVELEQNEEATYQIYNSYGQIVQNENLSTSRRSITIGHLPSAIYWLRIEQNEQVGIKTFVVE